MIDIENLSTKQKPLLTEIESAAMLEVQKAILVLLKNSLINKADIVQLRDYLTDYSKTIIDPYNREH